MEYLVRSSRAKENFKTLNKKRKDSKQAKKAPKKVSEENSSTSDVLKLYGHPKHKFYIGKYRLLNEIGKGGYGNVVTSRDERTKKIYAIKIIEKKIRRAGQLNNEAKINNLMRKKPSPFIIIVHQTFQTNGHLCMVMDFMENGTVNNHIKANLFSESKACFYTACMLLALRHLHKLDIAHKDVKPHNMALDKKGNIKLFDFGLSQRNISYNTPMHDKLGTGNFKSPEYFRNGPILRMVDFWALAVTLHLMMTGKYPSNGTPKSKKLSAECKSLLKKMFRNKEEKRLGWGDNGADEIMKHKFFKNIDFSDLHHGRVPPPKIKFTPPPLKNAYNMIKTLKAPAEFVDISYDSTDE